MLLTANQGEPHAGLAISLQENHSRALLLCGACSQRASPRGSPPASGRSFSAPAGKAVGKACHVADCGREQGMCPHACAAHIMRLALHHLVRKCCTHACVRAPQNQCRSMRAPCPHLAPTGKRSLVANWGKELDRWLEGRVQAIVVDDSKATAVKADLQVRRAWQGSFGGGPFAKAKGAAACAASWA